MLFPPSNVISGRTEPIPFHVKSDLTGLGKTNQDVRMIETTVSQRRGLDSERQQRENEEQRKLREVRFASFHHSTNHVNGLISSARNLLRARTHSNQRYPPLFEHSTAHCVTSSSRMLHSTMNTPTRTRIITRHGSKTCKPTSVLNPKKRWINVRKKSASARKKNSAKLPPLPASRCPNHPSQVHPFLWP